MISLIVVLFVHDSFGFNLNEWGTPLSQTLMQIGGSATIGLGTGLYPKSMLKRIFNVKTSWITALVIGFVVAELIAGIICWQLGLNRGELRFIEFRPLPESLIFACAGLTIGLLQWKILKEYFYKSSYWVIASCLGWGICVLVTQISFWAFFLGALLYGIITGATFIWILQRKNE